VTDDTVKFAIFNPTVPLSIFRPPDLGRKRGETEFVVALNSWGKIA
jgi:hypothetical protein